MPDVRADSVHYPVALTIAGSDSGGGAGIQADLKTFAACRVHGVCAVTALTAQNTVGVQAVHAVPAEFVAQQVDSVAGDLQVAAAKTGMLFSPAIIEIAADRLRKHALEKLVVDPVMVAQSGSPLLQPEAVETLITRLVPLATVFTPNLPEAERLTNRPIASLADMRGAVQRLLDFGPKAVMLKGGHLPEGDCIDLFAQGSDVVEFRAPRQDVQTTHGTGCTLSAAITARLARGDSVPQAVAFAHEFVQDALRFGFTQGHGPGCVNPLGRSWRQADKYRMVEELEAATRRLQAGRVGHLVPEVQMNFGYALEGAVTQADVLAYPGRLVRVGDSLHPVRPPRFGASHHVANLILTAQQYDPTIRAALNVRFSEKNVAAFRSAGFRVAEFSRNEETSALKEREGASLAFGMTRVAERQGGVPDVIFDRGDIGKEPMIRVFGTSPAEVVDKVLRAFGVTHDCQCRCGR